MPETVFSILESKHWQRIRQLTFASLILTVVVVAGFVVSGPVQSLSSQVFQSISIVETPSPIVTTRPDPATLPLPESFTLLDLDNHPDKVHRAYTTAPLVSLGRTAIENDHLTDFRDLLNVYVYRQAVDDNFTVRVLDRRTSGLLERYTLEEKKQRFLETGVADWNEIDVYRSHISGRLIGKYRRRGIPMEEIMIKWGRQDQVKEARERDAPFIEYEIRLSQTLGLSLLSTELGTVETFNDDKLISTVGARGRYQIMPSMLRRYDIQTFTLRTSSGGVIDVREEWHPLLTMETAFTIIKGYTNAVGHEIPGISAYHTGPFNIFRIYNAYLTKQAASFHPSSTVVDAYLWALTDGFEQISENSGFQHYSRSYIPTAYGSLRGAENLPIDTKMTLFIERVQTQAGARLYLRELLTSIATFADTLDWGFAAQDSSLYDRFRALNPHIDLPANRDTVLVHDEGNVLLTTHRSSQPVRFFLPPGTLDRLDADLKERFDHEATFSFNDKTYMKPADDGITVWDEQYELLVQDIQYFGFTAENRTRLNILVERFEKLVDSNPSTYRTLQLRIIKLHQNLWRTRFWSELANNTAAAAGRLEATVSQRPRPIGLTQRITFAEPTLEGTF